MCRLKPSPRCWTRRRWISPPWMSSTGRTIRIALRCSSAWPIRAIRCSCTSRCARLPCVPWPLRTTAGCGKTPAWSSSPSLRAMVSIIIWSATAPGRCWWAAVPGARTAGTPRRRCWTACSAGPRWGVSPLRSGWASVRGRWCSSFPPPHSSCTTWAPSQDARTRCARQLLQVRRPAADPAFPVVESHRAGDAQLPLPAVLRPAAFRAVNAYGEEYIEKAAPA